MSVLLLADTTGPELAADTLGRMLMAVQGLGPITVLVAGSQISAAATAAAAFAGVERVLAADCPALDHGAVEPLTALLRDLSPSHRHIAAAATGLGRSVLPRLAALLDVMIVPDVIAVHADGSFDRPIYAGSAIQTVRSRDPVTVMTLRTSAFAAASTQRAAPAPVVALATEVSQGRATWLGDDLAHSARPELGAARVVVSGGRGLASQENFALIGALADRLGGAVGASRAAVDQGFAPSDWQVGQTGKIVAPDLYVAVGISGAIQHLAGMKDSQVIVAINKDEEAPIFQVADYGLVGDLFDLVPALTAELGT